MSGENNPMLTFSDFLVKAIVKGGESTVIVNGRRRIHASGIVYAPDLIMTADHVLERDDDLSIIMADGSNYPATVAGRDPGNDIALLRLEKTSLKSAERTRLETQVGEIVIALGRPTTEGIEASLGIVSAVGGPIRTGRGGMLERYLRTDTVPFPGFSGGPLIDTEGRVVGLNTSGLVHGAPITLPAALIWEVAEILDKYGYIKRGYLGIRSQLVSISSDLQIAIGREQQEGLLLVSVEAGSPAEVSGLLVGDILVAINGQPVNDHDELFVYLNSQAVGKEASIQILRGGKPTTISVIPGERK